MLCSVFALGDGQLCWVACVALKTVAMDLLKHLGLVGLLESAEEFREGAEQNLGGGNVNREDAREPCALGVEAAGVSAHGVSEDGEKGRSVLAAL